MEIEEIKKFYDLWDYNFNRACQRGRFPMDDLRVAFKRVEELEGEIQLITAQEEATGRVYIAMKERVEKTKREMR